MRKLLFFSLILIVSNFKIYSQSDSIFEAKLTGCTYVENRSYRGDQFLTADWVTGDVYLSTGEIVCNKKFKYNGLQDELIWLNTKIPGVFCIDKSIISEFHFGDVNGVERKFVKINMNDSVGAKKQDVFVEELVKGKISLYVQRKIIVSDVMMIERDRKLYPLNFLSSMPVYFIHINSNFIKLPKLNKSAFYNLFSQNKNDLKKAVNKNNVDLRTENGLAFMIQMMNSNMTN